MNVSPIRFCCPSCGARIKAPIQLVGRGRDCPGCGRQFTVPSLVPEDVGPILVPIEAVGRYTFGPAYGRGA
jgi:hypothetical protein